MSMLRHIRIHTLAAGAHPTAAPSPSGTKLYRVFSDWLRPLYAYAVPHRPPAETASNTCRCRYPLYTFCSPTNSPFNDAGGELAVTAGSSASAGLSVCGNGQGPVGVSESDAADGSPSQSQRPSEAQMNSRQEESARAKLIQASMGAVGRRRATAPSPPAPSSPGAASAPGETPASLTQPCSPSASTPPSSKRRRGFFTWGGGGGGATGAVFGTASASNIIPNHAPAYRCEVCDYFQPLHEKDQTSAGLSSAVSTLSSAHEATQAARDAVPGEEVVAEEEEAEEEEDDEWDNVPSSTDIANTIMEDTEVAQLRFQDPFLVEVIGKVGLTRLANKFRKEFQAQLSRCQLSMTELTRRIAFVPYHNAQHERGYAGWVESTRVQARDRRKARTSASATDTPLSATPVTSETMDLAAYTVRFAVAVYGLPFELGYFNSVSEVAKLQADPHRRYTYATSEEQMESMRRMLQGEVPDPMLEFAASSYSITPNRACYAVVLDHKARRVVVAFRGSLTLADAICDVSEGYVQVDLAREGFVVATGLERGGLREVQSLAPTTAGVKTQPATLSRALLRPRLYQQLVTPQEKLAPSDRADLRPPSSEAPLLSRIPFGFYEAVTESARTLVPCLRSIHAQYPDYDLVLTGHSLGGIEASLFHLLFCFPAAVSGTRQDTPQPPTSSSSSSSSSSAAASLFPRVQTVTFGAAPIVEESAIPRLQAMLADEVRRSGSRLIHFAYGLDLVSRLQVRAITDLFQPPALSTLGAIETEKVSPAGSARPLVLSEQVLPTLVLPGDLYAIPHTRCRSCYPVDLQATWRRELVVTPESVFHHFPSFYLRTVNRLQRLRPANVSPTTRVKA